MAERQGEFWQPPAHNSSATAANVSLRGFGDSLICKAPSIWAGSFRPSYRRLRGNRVRCWLRRAAIPPPFSTRASAISESTHHAKVHFGYEIPDTKYYEGDAWAFGRQGVEFILAPRR